MWRLYCKKGHPLADIAHTHMHETGVPFIIDEVSIHIFIYSWLRAVVLSPTNCAILAEVSAKYILLTHPSIKTYFDRTEIGFKWTYKTVGLSLLMFSLVVNASSSKGAVLIQIIVTASQMLGVAIWEGMKMHIP